MTKLVWIHSPPHEVAGFVFEREFDALEGNKTNKPKMNSSDPEAVNMGASPSHWLSDGQANWPLANTDANDLTERLLSHARRWK